MICLTFDTDWMTDRDLGRFLREFPIPGEATFFLHDAFPSLFTTAHEICPHPLIEDMARWPQSLAELAGKLPRPAKGVRAHSCVFSHMIGLAFHNMGYHYVSQATNLFQAGLAPTRHPWGIWELPIYYMDNMDFWMARNWPDIGHVPFREQLIRMAVEQDSLFVFDFHPLHIALNTRGPEDYAAVKEKIVTNGVSPFDLTFPGRGVRTYFLELCSAMRSSGRLSRRCWDALAQLGCVPI